MKAILDLCLAASLFVTVLSELAMGWYFIKRGIHTYWELQWKVFWIPFRYRDHSLKYTGRVGHWYRVHIAAAGALVVSASIEVALELRRASGPITFLVIFVGLMLLSILAYAVYLQSKESYYS